MKSVVFSGNEYTVYSFTDPKIHGTYESKKEVLDTHKPDKVFIVKNLEEMYKANEVDNRAFTRGIESLSNILNNAEFKL